MMDNNRQCKDRVGITDKVIITCVYGWLNKFLVSILLGVHN